MGMLVIAEPRDWQKQLGVLLGLLLLAGGVALGLSWIAGRLGQPDDVWTADQVAQAVEQGAVERIVVRGDEATVETQAGARARVRQEAEGSVIDLLRHLDVSEERLSQVEIRVIPTAPILPTWLSRWISIVPIIILLLRTGKQ